MEAKEESAAKQEQPNADHSKEPQQMLTAEVGNNRTAPTGNSGCEGDQSHQPPENTPPRIPWYERFSLTDRITAISAAISALATVIIMVWAGLQWWEMHTSGTQTDKLIAAAKLIEEHQRQLVSDNKQVLLDNRNALGASLEENRKALQAQTAASNGQLAAVRRQTEIAEQPWVTVDTSFRISQGEVWVGNDTATGKPILKHPSELMKYPNQAILGGLPATLTATLVNGGRSPALNYFAVTRWRFVDLPPVVSPDFSNVAIPSDPDCLSSMKSRGTGFVLFPNKIYTVEMTPQIPDEKAVDQWMNGKAILFAYGCVKYQDELATAPRQTDFCSYLLGGELPDKWHTCVAGNKAY